MQYRNINTGIWVNWERGIGGSCFVESGSGEAILCACPAVTTFPSSKWAVIIVLPFLLDLSDVEAESNCLAKLSLKCIKILEFSEKIYWVILYKVLTTIMINHFQNLEKYPSFFSLIWRLSMSIPTILIYCICPASFWTSSWKIDLIHKTIVVKRHWI